MRREALTLPGVKEAAEMRFPHRARRGWKTLKQKPPESITTRWNGHAARMDGQEAEANNRRKRERKEDGQGLDDEELAGREGTNWHHRSGTST